jgi:hypothetical protein
VFSLFPNKRELFLAASSAASSASPQRPSPGRRRVRPGARAGRRRRAQGDGAAYVELLATEPRLPDAPAPGLRRLRRRGRYAELIELAQELSGADEEQLNEFFRAGMALNVAAALGVDELSIGCPWVQAELR